MLIYKKLYLIYFSKNKKIYDINEDDILEWHEWLSKKNYSLRYKNKCHMVIYGYGFNNRYCN